MAKWKMAGHMAVVMREAEKQAEQKRILEEQFQESIRNGNILRKLDRQRERVRCRAKAPYLRDEHMMEVLNKERENREWDCHVASSDYFRRQDDRHRQVLMENIHCKETQQEEINKVYDAMETIRHKDKELDKEILGNKLKLKAQNLQLGNVHVISRDKVLRRQEVIHQAYGKQLEENRKLVEKITHLEGELDKVKNIRRQLDQDCEELSKQVHDYSEKAKTTYESRDMNRLNMGKLKDHLDKRTTAFESDMQLLQFKIDVLKRMERFMTTKNKFRHDEGKDRRMEHQSVLSVTEKDSMYFGSLLDKILSDLEQNDIHMIIRTFIELEEENYMLFKNISETREACQDMMMQIEAVKAKISSFSKAKLQSEQEAFARKVELMDKAERCKKESDKKEEHIKKADQVMQTYIKGILAMLGRLGYTESHIQQLAGVYKHVEERNIHEFLAEIEHYVNKIYDLKTLSDFLAYDLQRKSAQMPPPPEPLPPRLALVQMVVVVPPYHEEGEDIDDPALPAEAAFRPLALSEISHHVDEDLDIRERRDELGVPIPSPTMTDATSDIIGDTPHSPSPRKSCVDVF